MSKISSLSSNAILAKARAMYSNALTEEDYNELINCHSVTELANYLKNHTVYSAALSSASSMSFSRARTEARIRKFTYERIAELASFESAIGLKLNEIIYLSYDVNLILSCADHLDSDVVSDFSLFTPQAYIKHSQIDPVALEKATDFNQFYDALAQTKYKKPLDIIMNGTMAFSIQALENALYNYLCSQIRTIIKKNYSGEDEKELLSLFTMKSDFKMIESIYRMKKYFSDEPLDLTKIFYSGLSDFSVKEIQQLINCKTIEEFFSILNVSKYKKYFSSHNSLQIEKYTRIALQKFYENKLRFSTCPEVVMFSYIFILENETKNIIHITEGIRYGLPPERISEFLTL